MGKEIKTFADTEFEKHTFHLHKCPVSIWYKHWPNSTM